MFLSLVELICVQSNHNFMLFFYKDVASSIYSFTVLGYFGKMQNSRTWVVGVTKDGAKGWLVGAVAPPII